MACPPPQATTPDATRARRDASAPPRRVDRPAGSPIVTPSRRGASLRSSLMAMSPRRGTRLVLEGQRPFRHLLPTCRWPAAPGRIGPTPADSKPQTRGTTMIRKLALALAFILPFVATAGEAVDHDAILADL